MGHHYRNAPAWNTHDNEMAVRMPPSERTSASQRIFGQTNHLKSQPRNTAKRHWPDCTHDTISPELSTPHKGVATETIDTPSPYKMDEEMQADQELLTAALEEEERAYNVYKNKIDEWNTWRTKMEPEDKNASTWVTNDD